MVFSVLGMKVFDSRIVPGEERGEYLAGFEVRMKNNIFSLSLPGEKPFFSLQIEKPLHLFIYRAGDFLIVKIEGEKAEEVLLFVRDGEGYYLQGVVRSKDKRAARIEDLQIDMLGIKVIVDHAFFGRYAKRIEKYPFEYEVSFA